MYFIQYIQYISTIYKSTINKLCMDLTSFIKNSSYAILNNDINHNTRLK